MNLFDEVCKKALNESMENNEVLNERPYSRTRSAIDSIKGKAKSFVGSGQVEQGARESGEYANRLWADFKRNMGRKYGKTPSVVTYEDVANFLKGNSIDTKYLGANRNRSFTPQDVSKIFLQASSDIVDQYPGDKEKEQDPRHIRVSPNADAEENKKPEEQKPESSNSGTQSQNNNSQNSSSGALSSSIRNLSPEKREQLLNLLG